MKRKLSTSPDTDTVIEAEVIAADQPHPPTSEPVGFIDTDELLRRLPVSRGTIRNWRKSGRLPYICLAGRRVLFDWESCRQALLRNQRGGGVQ